MFKIIQKSGHCVMVAALLMTFVACGSSKSEPSTAQSQEKVHHVFGEDLKPAKEVAAEVKDKEEVVKEKVQADQEKVKQDAKEVTQEVAKIQVQEDTPLAVIKQYTKELRALDTATKQASDRDQVISKKVRKFFDFQTLAKESLGSHWHQINKTDQRQYSDLFISLIERSYLSRSKKLVGDYNLQFKNEKIIKNKSSVDCVVEMDDVDIDIIYHLHRKSGKWMIYNINFDNIDLIKNYRSQFGRIINKSKFAGLVDVMEKKLASSPTNI